MVNRRPDTATAGSRYNRLCFFLASFSVNLSVFLGLMLLPRSQPDLDKRNIIPVTLITPPSETEIDPPPSAEPPRTAPERPEVPPMRTIEGPPSAPPEQSPAAPAAKPPSVMATPTQNPDHPPSDTPAEAALATPEEAGEADVQAVQALRIFNCARLGVGRPAYCDDLSEKARGMAVVQGDGGKTMDSRVWEIFRSGMDDPDIRRIQAEGCPAKDGVINDAFIEDDAYYRQGVASAAGKLSRDSTNKFCP